MTKKQYEEQIKALKELVDIQRQTIDALKAREVLQQPYNPYHPYQQAPVPWWQPYYQPLIISGPQGGGTGGISGTVTVDSKGNIISSNGAPFTTTTGVAASSGNYVTN